MNCQEFERAVVGIDCSHLTGADAQASALTHAETCPQCAARLHRERRLTAGLQAFAVDEAAINAPERVRLALRAAFDERQGVAANRLSPLSFASRRLSWGLAAAAMLLISITIIALWPRDRGEKLGDAPPALPKPDISQDFPGAPPTPPTLSPLLTIQPPPPRASRPTGGHIWRGARKIEESVADKAEIFPLTFVAKSETAEFVQTVRVEISRSTLLMMGLPINPDRGEGMIKADLIIGEDGVARAVRLLN
ncbi:MAG TPA: hypothetical protein VJ810_36840 [Blastocatellia bacterium]|nr:hypothetical protein [Blastocatellia bacterium]